MKTDKDMILIDEEKAVQEAENWLNQKTFSDIREEFYSRGSFSVYLIHAIAEGKEMLGCGFSKARQEVSAANFDTELGKKVSRGRAIHDLFLDYKKNKKV